MRRLRPTLCALCLLLLTPLLLRARQLLPLDTRPLVAEKYAGWSGVLRLWVFEGWPCGGGSVSPWLNHCIARFEKNHPGVYVQPRFVDAGAISSLNDSGILPPHMILFPPSLLDSPKGLAPLEASGALRPALRSCGHRNGSTYATPVAMGGYMWAWNAALVDGIPNDWAGIDPPLTAPVPETWRRWDAALLALCAGTYGSPEPDERNDSANPPGGLDLGFVEPATSPPTPAPSPEAAERIPRRLPDSFDFDSDAWRHFINGETAAMPVTQREVRRLQALSDQGRGPDWQLSPGDAAFTDQLLNLAIVNRPDAGQQQALCAEFLDFLLTEECQGALHLASAFSVTDAPSGYEASDPLAAMDIALRDRDLVVPNVFDAGWASATEEIVRKFIGESGDSAALWQRLSDRLTQNPNN